MLSALNAVIGLVPFLAERTLPIIDLPQGTRGPNGVRGPACREWIERGQPQDDETTEQRIAGTARHAKVMSAAASLIAPDTGLDLGECVNRRMNACGRAPCDPADVRPTSDFAISIPNPRRFP
jgi:hypothetical protein